MIPLSRKRERDGVRVGLQKYPLTVALRHPVFSDLYKAVRDFLLSPQGEEIRNVQSQKIPKIW